MHEDGPATDEDGPVPRDDEHVGDADPATETGDPAAERGDPAVESDDPAAERDDPAVESDDPAVEDGPAVEPGVAEPAQRLVARLIDTLIVGVPIGTVATALFPRETAQTVVAPLAFAALFFGYEAVQLALWGRTVGKRLTGIRVVSVTGGRPGVIQSVVRAAIYALPPAARPVPVLNVLAGIFWLAEIGLLFEGPYRQALHDRAAGTLVVPDRPAGALAVPD